MNNIFQEKRNIFLLLVGLLFMLCMVLYFAFLSPLLGDMKQKEQSIESLQADVAVLEKRVEKLGENQENFEKEHALLQKKIPFTRKLDEIVLILQDIERQSSSLIKSVDYQYESSFPTAIFSKELEVNEEDQSVGKSDEGVLPTIDFGEKPESLQIFTIQMDVSSPTYEDFLQFITDIEQQERIMSVSRLRVDKPTEAELSEDEMVTYNVELITFYYD